MAENVAASNTMPATVRPKSFSFNGTAAKKSIGEPTQVQKAFAKYDYNPKIHSPMAALQSELTFHKGDVILIYGERDDNGFYVGELNGKRAMVPYNFLQYPLLPVNASTPNSGQVESNKTGNALESNTVPATVRPKGVAYSETVTKKSNGEPTRIRKAFALYNYDPKIQSPNADAEQFELVFHAADIILIHGEIDKDGFYNGELNGKRRLVPSNFILLPGQTIIDRIPNTRQSQPIVIGIPAEVDAILATVQKGVAFSSELAIRWVYRFFGFAILFFIIYLNIEQIYAEGQKFDSNINM